MIENIQLELNPSVKKQHAIATSIALFSQDVDNYSFDITFTDLELQADDEVEVLAKLPGGNLEYNSSTNLVDVDGKLVARYVFDTKLIDSEGPVFCYVYLKRGDKSADVGAFYFEADLSELDKVVGKIAEVYDGRYEDLVAEFEIKLQEYRDSLPQASEVHAEVDVLLNQFGMDSQAKLNQYDTDAQQVISDNQTAFNLAEESRVEAEGDRDSAETSRKANEADRVQAENERENTEESRERSEGERKANEESRELTENERENAEAQRKIDHANRSAELAGKADKVVLKNELTNPTFSNGLDGWRQSVDNEAVVNGNEVTITTSRKGKLGLYQGYNQEGLKYISAEFYSEDITSGFTLGNTSVVTTFPNGVWTRVSTVNSDEGIIRFYADAGLDRHYKIRKPIIINLTQTFGAGNEPTKEEMDELIKDTGYIDGEYALNNKDMLIWTLALIRRNKNALIALGGTII